MKNVIKKLAVILGVSALGVSVALAGVSVSNNTAQRAYVKWGNGNVVSIDAGQSRVVEVGKRDAMPKDYTLFANSSVNPPSTPVMNTRRQSISVNYNLTTTANVTLTGHQSADNSFSGTCLGKDCH